ncbi:hypothetical protein K469DRAFT_704806 [Zopfia rhizophila CBS 207.26]|uniref:Uncharacterized protein n=1 Tax=Zopfia rhizophila CBS 207.26 TaxID=1314779 RepID=A0A6A6E7Q6_9PEZI|nr:hypothetical protein K469DRAFT_704806 [Zopfia rhizophila CBS 207.26]
MDLLPYCTAETPLNKEQLIGLSDVAGNLREVVLLALGGVLDDEGRDILEGAVGVYVAAAIKEFFKNEWVYEG